jgi:hypothetical protein
MLPKPAAFTEDDVERGAGRSATQYRGPPLTIRTPVRRMAFDPSADGRPARPRRPRTDTSPERARGRRASRRANGGEPARPPSGRPAPAHALGGAAGSGFVIGSTARPGTTVPRFEAIPGDGDVATVGRPGGSRGLGRSQGLGMVVSGRPELVGAGPEDEPGQGPFPRAHRRHRRNRRRQPRWEFTMRRAETRTRSRLDPRRPAGVVGGRPCRDRPNLVM